MNVLLVQQSLGYDTFIQTRTPQQELRVRYSTFYTSKYFVRSILQPRYTADTYVYAWAAWVPAAYNSQRGNGVLLLLLFTALRRTQPAVRGNPKYCCTSNLLAEVEQLTCRSENRSTRSYCTEGENNTEETIAAICGTSIWRIALTHHIIIKQTLCQQELPPSGAVSGARRQPP